ncbi:hypothetical protein KUV50_14790 [Membranicola marinus]|uniref:TolB protein n=1 Tax=Membranihabitans marinus TaxID=1227546 RepID=A0A953LA10_9BACT|nr:hypothetical protein [Membranihabitans marinus]MBY5959415.1 hypothetical protein [Membranihabitans marinus]
MNLITKSLLTLGLFFTIFTTGYSQYFGKNKPKYETQNFSILQTPHFDMYHYLRDRDQINKISQWTEQWHSMHQEVFRDTFPTHNPFILYNDHGDFQQTRAIGGNISIGTGGVTEALKNRVILPIAMTNQQTFHVIGHELVHAFQYNIILGGDSTGLQNLQNLPLFMVEGLAEYMSKGPKDSQTAMWMRDAVKQGTIPGIKDLTNPRFFPYRWGQTFWSFLAGRFGDRVIRPFFQATGAYGFDNAVALVLGTTTDSLSSDWKRNLKAFYDPFTKNKDANPAGRVIINENNGGRMNLAPMVSPDGEKIIFFSEKRVLSTDLYIADANTGKIEERISTNAFTGSIDDVDFIESAGTWSPDGEQFAYVIIQRGRSVLMIKNKKGNTVKSFGLKNVSKFSYPDWSPDGKYVVVSGLEQGQTDLYEINLRTERANRLTNNTYSEIMPNYSPDGSRIYFSTDEISYRQGRTGASWNFNIAHYDRTTEETTHLNNLFPGADNLNPVSDKEGNLYFLSDRDGYRNMYMINTNDSSLYQVTDIVTGVSGITPFSSAISVTDDGRKVYYNYYTNNKYQIYSYTPDISKMTPVDPSDVDQTAALLPTYTRRSPQIVQRNLNTLDEQPLMATSEFHKEKYRPKFKLDYISGGGGVGVGMGNFIGTSTGLAGGVDAIFSDILGNNQIYSTLALNGEIYDLGAQILYRNQTGKIGWGGGISHVPFRYSSYPSYIRDSLPVNGGSIPVLDFTYDIYRVFQDQISMFSQYAFNQSIRVEAGGGYSLYYYRTERWHNYYDDFGRIIYQDREKVESPDGFGLFNVQTAFVGDNSTFGFTSPLNGYRFRVGVTQNFGHWNYLTTLVDLRKYFYLKKSSLAVRALQYGQYGEDANNNNLSNYVIYPTFIRGYSNISNVKLEELGLTNSVRGSKLFVGNVEFRVPFTGPEELAIIPTGFILSQLALFYDVGTAWSRNNPFDAPEGFEPKILQSVGVALRVNLFGALILEPFYAKPLIDGVKGSFGLNFVPGW